MICNVCYKKAGKWIIYFGKIYFPIRQIKYTFCALEWTGFKRSGKFIYVQYFIP